ncbi:MAG: hypothetical protein JNL38_33265 [Myxococcales bacterium]|jgi:hypothetical protein|nr:hypothetical protein [Myxococcales bacterium]
MRARLLHLVAVSFLALTASAGCAPAEESKDNGGSAAVNDGVDNEIRTASDAAIMGKLKGILKDVTFTSESDYGYVVFEGEAVPAGTKRLTTALLRQKLAAGVKANSDDHRDIAPTKCRAVRLNVSSTIADGDAAVVPTDPNADDFVYAKHDKQLGIALKTMRASLKNVVGYTFGTNESGDQDELGTVVYVYVGVSKTTGKLIAIMTQAVYT